MKYPIRSEQLKHAISIKKKTPGQDDYGDPLDTYTNIAINIHAFVEQTSGSEFYAAQKLNAEANYNVWIRYRNGILSSMYVFYKNKLLEIVEPPIDLYESHRWMRIVCKEVV